MGIQGLLPLLKDASLPIHISSYSGRTLGIDTYVWLHRGAYGCAREIVLGDPNPRYISYALSRIAVEFRQMAILSGCDYLPSIVGMGLKNAHRLLRRHKTVDKVLQVVRLEGKMSIPPTYPSEFRKAELTFVHQRVFDPSSSKVVTLTPLPSGTHDDMLPFIGAHIEDEMARAIADGIVDPITRERILDRVARLGMRCSSASNLTASSSGLNTLHRSTTAPISLGGGSGLAGSSFDKSSVSTASGSFGGGGKKKVVSKETGLQSLKIFFGAPKSREKSEKKEERIALAPRDTNRPWQPSARPPWQPVKEVKATQSKLLTRSNTTPHPTTVCKTPKVRQDHAYLHLGGQLTPPKANDSGYWQDECHDLHDFVPSSSPPQIELNESQRIVMDTQQLCLASSTADIREQREASVAPTQSLQSTGASGESGTSAAVVVPQTPSRKRMRSQEAAPVLSSPESAMESGFISSPASSVCGRGKIPAYRGNGGEEEEEDEEEVTLPSSPLLDDMVVEPVTPLMVKSKAMLNTSASRSKVEAFRYPAATPQHQHQQKKRVERVERGRTTLPRRATELATRTAGKPGLSPSLLKLASWESISTPAGARSGAFKPRKMPKRSPTLLLREQEAAGAAEGSAGEGSKVEGLFDRFRFSEPVEQASTGAAQAGGGGKRQLSF
ncbi:uncharacterized protein UHO2_04081 [Ustilago hordei]|uniref:uncharacterized protein n=1 Tax=Ustilago hordei TaxID=120017 RepID=UPI001A55CD16|nr:uncharacterized protein UHO2_04081 [Ustilago hordei]SYW86584.1 related to EXO1 - exonuclease which interacts with Msh2p [Ustilago hordei]